MNIFWKLHKKMLRGVTSRGKTETWGDRLIGVSYHLHVLILLKIQLNAQCINVHTVEQLTIMKQVYRS